MWKSLQRQGQRQLYLYGLILGWHRNAGLGECLGLVSNRLGTQNPEGQGGAAGTQLAWGWGHHLDAPLQAVFQVPASRVVRE